MQLLGVLMRAISSSRNPTALRARSAPPEAPWKAVVAVWCFLRGSGHGVQSH